MSLLTEAAQIIHPNFTIGQKEENVQLTEKCQYRMNKLIEKLKGKEIGNFNLPYVKNEIDEFIKSKPDPELEIPTNVVIELLEQLVYSNNKKPTADDKIIIAYLAIYCSI